MFRYQLTARRDSYGIWFGDNPPERQTDYVKELNRTADDDLRDRMGSLLARIVPLEKLETVTFEIDSVILEAFEKSCHDAGLTVQNALHIAMLRLVKSPEEFISTEKDNKALSKEA